MNSNNPLVSPVVFLDIDGVLNNSVWGRRRSRDQSYLDPENIACLNQLIREIDADFVISSQWRTQMPLEDVVSYLTSDGFEGRIIGATPYYEIGPLDPRVCRGKEIEGWLTNKRFEGNFVIIDDRGDMEPYSDRLVQTDFDVGFRLSHLPKAIEILNKPVTRSHPLPFSAFGV